MSADEINFAPDVQGTIEATRSRMIGWREILGELIDNAFDAGATSVDIVIDNKEITVTDNGDGCSDFEAMLTMGKHTRHRSTQLGRYGVGLKDAAWWVGGPTRITSVHRGVKQVLSVNWDALSRWSLPSPHKTEAAGSRGTVIRFDRIARRFPDGKQFDDLLADIGFIYTPAIKHGKQISFRRGRGPIRLAQRHELPTGLTDTIDDRILVGDKRARVFVGIVPEGVDNPKPGISYTHGFRVIIPATALGCGGYGCARLAGWVILEDGWRLTRNKDDISAHKEELADAVYARIKDVVAKASRQAMALRSASLSESLTAEFRDLVMSGDGEKEKRDSPKNPTGRVEPKNSGRTREPRKTQSDGFRKNAGRLRIDFRAFNDDSLGSVDRDGGTIWLAENHPRIAEAKSTENKLALLFAAVLLFAAREKDSPKPLLPLFRDGSSARDIEILAGRLLGESKHSLRLVGAA